MENFRDSFNTIKNIIVANGSKISKNEVTDNSVIKDLKEAAKTTKRQEYFTGRR